MDLNARILRLAHRLKDEPEDALDTMCQSIKQIHSGEGSSPLTVEQAEGIRLTMLKTAELFNAMGNETQKCLRDLDLRMGGASQTTPKAQLTTGTAKGARSDEGPAKKRACDDKSKLRRPPGWETRVTRPGDRVAAKIASHDLWILTTVSGYNTEDNTFAVIDDDDPDDVRQYNIKPENMMNLPEEEEAKASTFPEGSRVLAMYPQTTSFYRALVATAHEACGNNLVPVQFDDDEDDMGKLPVRPIPARFVCSVPEDYQGWKHT
ncbi:unnamed protein product [Chrysoparadoxa australica]